MGYLDQVVYVNVQVSIIGIIYLINKIVNNVLMIDVKPVLTVLVVILVYMQLMMLELYHNNVNVQMNTMIKLVF